MNLGITLGMDKKIDYSFFLSMMLVLVYGTFPHDDEKFTEGIIGVRVCFLSGERMVHLLLLNANNPLVQDS